MGWSIFLSNLFWYLMDNELLKYAVENGMINVSYVQEQIKMKKRKELLEKHPYKIWEGKDGKWYTYIPDKKRGRILKKRNSENEIEDVVISYLREKTENPTVDEVFESWISKKLERDEISKATRDRYYRQYDESFSVFGKNRIKDVSEYEIEDFMVTTLHEKNMTAKGFSNFRTLIFGIFKYAKKMKFVSYSITELVNDMEISRKSFRRNKKDDNELVFMDDELPRVTDYLKNNEDIMNIGLLILFKSGLRIGELASLKCEDVTGNIIHVHRTEICYEDGGKRIFEVRDFPKTEAGVRDVIIPEKYVRYLRKACSSSSGEYLFESNGKRIMTYQFRNRLRTVCRKTNVVCKSPHKVRKTYASMLIDSGVSESVVISQMGHTDIRTTKGFYYKNRSNEKSKTDIINSVEIL